MKTTANTRASSLCLRAPAAALAAVLLLAGCGGDAQEPAEPEAATPSESAPAAESEAEPEDSATESEPAEESATQDTNGATEAAPEDLMITIAEFAFEVPESIPAGSEITVVNQDAVGHTVTSDEEGIFDIPVGPGEEVTFTVPEEAGEFPFHCTPHPNMVSTLVVG